MEMSVKGAASSIIHNPFLLINTIHDSSMWFEYFVILGFK